MAYSNLFLEVLFLVTVGILWSMIFYQLFFTFMGLFYRIKTTKEKRIYETDRKNLPPVSILVPAHNEEQVIERTLESLCRMDYPSEKIEIVVVNDGSTDQTPQIVREFRRKDSRVKLYSIPEEEAGKGKPHALNKGLTQVKHEYIAVYDADNTPEPDSLRYLVLNLMDDPGLASAFGKFRTRNQKRNLLTRFINLETLSFQFMIQAGRYLLLKMALLPGTNFLIRRKALVECGGWDEEALTEDTELSIRLYKKGYRIKFVPYSVTWEEEPEKWKVWLKQRCRWVRGNFYILRKFFLSSFRSKKINIILELSYIFLLYYLFLASILFSHLFFITSGLGFIAVLSPGPYLAVWGCAFLLFTTEIIMVASFEGEASFENLGVTILMYFSYCQGWIVLVFRALYQEIFKKPIHWEKTPRFASQENQSKRRDHEH
ncbi:glycosyltransferase family 2 protein [bacterium]|nr:glycosyltransferase family 2 protein [bacterium]